MSSSTASSAIAFDTSENRAYSSKDIDLGSSPARHSQVGSPLPPPQIAKNFCRSESDHLSPPQPTPAGVTSATKTQIQRLRRRSDKRDVASVSISIALSDSTPALVTITIDPGKVAPPLQRWRLESVEKLARVSSVSHRLGMEHDCEVCACLPRAISRARTMVEIQLDERAVVLCRGHARIAANSGVTDFEGLRALYGSGRRSHVPRRDPRAPKAGEKRASLGRRVADYE